VNIELEKITSETQVLNNRFVNDRRALSKRKTELFEEFKSQISTWALTRPHSDELEDAFLEQRKTIVSINDEFGDWTRRYNEAQKQLQGDLTPPSESDDETKLFDVQRFRELLRNFEPELLRLEKIINRFEGAVRILSSFNSSPERN
jgi:hypothetical protein